MKASIVHPNIRVSGFWGALKNLWLFWVRGFELGVSGLGLTGDSEVFIRVGVNQIGSFRAGCGKT